MSTAFRCIQDYDSLYEIKYVKEQNMERDPAVHWHTKYELVFVTEGQGNHYVNGKHYDLSAGDVFLVSPADFHRYFPKENSVFRAVRINFSNAFYFYYLNPNCRFSEFPVTGNMKKDDLEKVKKLSELLWNEYNEPDSMVKNELCRDLIEQILILVARNSSQPEKKSDDDKLKAALDYIQNNFYNPIKISDIAKAVSYAPNYLSSRFSKSIGINISDYLQEMRLYYARELIQFSEFSISEICYKSGFKTMTYFSKAFKTKFSLSPNAYKSMLKK